MKSIRKITRVKLNINEEDKFHLLAIVSTDPDYKLSLSINSKLKISLKNISPVNIISDEGSELTFSRFSDMKRVSGIVYTLFSNRYGKHFLLKKLKNVDFIFKVQDPENRSIELLTNNLREIESVNAVFKIDTNSFKDKMLQYLNQ
jgi:hypothetical protein